MKNILTLFFQKTFDIRAGELKRTLLMQLYIFFIISTLLIIKPTINSLFLSELGINHLPFAFILVALIAGIITTFYSKLLNKVSLNKIIHYTLLISVFSIGIFSILLRFNIVEKWILYFFYVWVAIFGVLSTSQFWILASIIFNSLEAKRLFSFIGGGAISGGIFGGYLASILAPILGSENLLFIGAIFLLICTILLKSIWKSNKTTSSSVFVRKQRTGKVSEHPFRLIINSKHLSYLALITAISVTVAKLVDYQFSAISISKINNQDELTAFFGFWLSNLNIMSLLIQLFVTRKVVGSYGVGISLFFLPAGIFIGAIAILISPGLWSAIFIKSSDGSLKQSLNKSALELLALPIPAEVKKQAKTFIDVFVDSFATGLSGIILITLVNGFNLSVKFVSIIILILILVWFYFARKVRLEYLMLFKIKLNINNTPIKVKNNHLDLSKESVFSGLKKILEHGSETQILFILNNITDDKREKLFQSIKFLLNHDSPIIISAALKKLFFYKSENLNTQIYPLVAHTNEQIRIHAIEYIIEHSGALKIKTIKKFIEHDDTGINGAALIALCNLTKDNNRLQNELKIAEYVTNNIKALKKETNKNSILNKYQSTLLAIGKGHLIEFYYFIHECLNADNKEISTIAIQAASETLDKGFILKLISFLSIKEYNKASVKAIANYGFRVLPILQSTNLYNYEPPIVREFPIILELIGTQESVDFLFTLLKYNDVVVRNNAVQALINLKLIKPHLIFNNKQIFKELLDEANLFMDTLSAIHIQNNRFKDTNISESNTKIIEARVGLITLLNKRLDDNLSRIFKILGLKYPTEEILSAYNGIKSKKVEIRINSLEFLDNLLESNIKKILNPIIESSSTETITQEILKELKNRINSQLECFNLLLEGNDYKIKLSVLYLIAVLKDEKYVSLLRKHTKNPNDKIKQFAIKSLDIYNS